MAEPLEVTVDLANQNVQFTGRSRSNPAVTMDYFPPLGEGQGYTGLELLLMSLAGCSATSIVYLLRKMDKNIAGFSVRARGLRREVHPTSFHTIVLEFAVLSADADEASVKKAIHLSEESLCPVWALLKNNVEIRTEYRIVAP
jgi:putative redox protein